MLAGQLEQSIELRTLGRGDLVFEFMMNALRLTDGFDRRLFEERTGLSVAVLSLRLAEAERRGLLEQDLHRIRPTLLGRRYLNDLLQLFLD